MSAAEEASWEQEYVSAPASESGSFGDDTDSDLGEQLLPGGEGSLGRGGGTRNRERMVDKPIPSLPLGKYVLEPKPWVQRLFAKAAEIAAI
mmetsp:Transcript_20174/g.60858  ORF Transcript_20174/g.60858 Transcript_20174/m.60858 type:complete len:91 (-) Transcript_20174:482-754(-)